MMCMVVYYILHNRKPLMFYTYLITLNVTTATNWFSWYYILLEVKELHTITHEFMQMSGRKWLRLVEVWYDIIP